MEKCPKCGQENKEMHWLQSKLNNDDAWVCAYCYNGTYSAKQVERIRNKKL